MVADGLAEPNHIQAQTALDTFVTTRAWNLLLFDTLSPESLSQPVHHPERGQMLIRTIFETVAGHDLHHLNHVAAISHSR